MQPSPWQYKPWWCQPWSILLTGSSLIAGTGWLSQRLWLTALVAIPVTAWMGFFLLVWPALMRQSGLLEQWAAKKTAADVPASPPPEP